MSSIKALVAISVLVLSPLAFAQWGGNNPGWGRQLQYQYAGQKPGPAHGSPYGLNYCGTEYPSWCNYYGQECYVNNGYWWDNARQVNWFNYYRCQ